MRISKILPVLLALVLALSACQQQPAWEDVKSETWWHDAVFYQIFVRSFADSDGDGIGDFNGITQKLDYLNDGKAETTTDLGINAIWLMPIHPSPSYHGYDVTDYYDVNPKYGTLEDFKTFLDEAHKRGIRVIVDFVINHTSDRHPWFQASAKSEAPYQNWYIWEDNNPGYRGPTGQTVWHALGDRFYYGLFVKEMPDLNYNEEAVTAEITKVAGFWLNEVGVDGFRVDGAKHLIEAGQAQENTRATHDWFKQFYGDFKALKGDAVLVGEVWSPGNQAATYVRNGEMDMVFNFPLADDIIRVVTIGNGGRIGYTINQHALMYGEGRYGTFLSNHDQTRVMTRLLGDETRAKNAATILLTAPGTPFLYYGEEIGMTGDKPDPDIRTPMQWTSGENAGFTTGTPWKPVNTDYTTRSVEAQDEDENSLLNHYRKLIRLRLDHYALRDGQFVQVIANNTRLAAMLRVAEKESVLVLINLGNEPISDPRLKWEETPLSGTLQPTLLMGSGEIAPITVREDGSIADYQPIAEIPANGTLIVQFRP